MRRGLFFKRLNVQSGGLRKVENTRSRRQQVRIYNIIVVIVSKCLWSPCISVQMVIGRSWDDLLGCYSRPGTPKLTFRKGFSRGRFNQHCVRFKRSLGCLILSLHLTRVMNNCWAVFSSLVYIFIIEVLCANFISAGDGYFSFFGIWGKFRFESWLRLVLVHSRY